MPDAAFKGDPYHVLALPRDASSADVKRRWRELAREHHPDRAAGDRDEQARLTTRMARINAAYDVLRDPARRARYDASPQARRTRDAEARGRSFDGRQVADDGWAPLHGPPQAPPSRPVTARFDTSAAFHRRNSTTSASRAPLRGQGPREPRVSSAAFDLRASTPTGPVRRRRSGSGGTIPSLADARSTALDFGRFHGHTLGEVADREPTYIDWIARTITRDRDLVIRARVIAADLDERGVERATRPPHAGFGTSPERETAEAHV